MMETINSNLNLLSEDPSTTTPIALFPVTFFDGEREIDVGTVPITPSLTFKSFQSILSSKLQISPHQITIYFQRPNYNDFHHHHRRRHAVTNKFDFENAMAVPDSAFYVVQKRSRRTRRRKPRSPAINGNNDFVLLRRDNNCDYNNIFNNLNNHVVNGGNYNLNEYLEYVNRLRLIQEVEREREKYMMSMNLNSNVYEDLSFGYGGGGGYYGNFSDDAASSSSSSVFCDVCYNAAVRGGIMDETVPFHWCKNDVVTKVFRSPAGPIAPPNKKKSMVDFFA
uniref:DUF7138 domain-containing protein n=1 Tax=Chenopodium quinoa TaxID=63459 RepID=A0A803L343_CHEQI